MQLTTLTEFQTEANAIADIRERAATYGILGHDATADRLLFQADTRQSLLDAAVKIASMESSGRLPPLPADTPLDADMQRLIARALHNGNAAGYDETTPLQDPDTSKEPDLNLSSRFVQFADALLLRDDPQSCTYRANGQTFAYLADSNALDADNDLRAAEGIGHAGLFSLLFWVALGVALWLGYVYLIAGHG